ncbi:MULTISPECIES: hypothetical protein [unclassified Rathayibacter]|jgi:hypothetical protein|uniref:hypothetical protein n=1 Tax=unclassified Rathayibacter TaxID=2609250 RepID=UPI000CE87FBE|nr:MULTISPECIES: hypothetical protein [unclassified Rathayibacter]PPF20451.1 hypothetical protein C5B95_08440 [Rathayibacter sp. AY1A7]PPF50713.1 hypothetical protein C5E14_01280 [Rathayibacter sp. AY1A1]PPG85430.1 hypothetical protein C5C29_05705 [Rathayibacter sp. AY1H2]PPH00080.1 hypothetical protein C5C32_09605 [Rathayibacter sp. AY1G9]PPH17177.1 hypothetical protein C5C35_07535 [Rathayibacter sp. AY1F8]
MAGRSVSVAVTATVAALVVAAGAWAALATPWGSGVVRDVASGVVPASPAALTGDETYLASELEALVVGGSVLGELTGVDPGDGELGVERVTDFLGGGIEPESCRAILDADALHPAGYRSRTGAGFESELLLLPSVTAAADRYGDLLRASGRCHRIEERSQDYDLLRTTTWIESGTGSAPSDGPDDAVHWFAGVRSDDVGVTTAVVTATTGNVLQVFRLVQSPDSSGLGKAVAERLARSALLALQNRADGASAVGYASGTPVTPDPEPTGLWALSQDGLPEAPATALSPAFFSSAPVPALCEFDAGTLVDGVLPTPADEPGGVYLHDEGVSTGAHLAVLAAPTTADAAGVSVIGCSHGGVNWPDSLVFYAADGRVLDAIGLPEIVPGGYRDQVLDLTADADGGFRVSWYWEDLGGSQPTRPVTATMRWDGTRLVIADVLIGERST